MSALERIITRSRSEQLARASQLAEDQRRRLASTNSTSSNITPLNSLGSAEKDDDSTHQLHVPDPAIADAQHRLDSLELKVRSLNHLKASVTKLSDR